MTIRPYKLLYKAALWLCVALISVDALAESSQPPATKQEEFVKIDIRAVGDSAYIGNWEKEETIDKNIPQGKLPEKYFERRLEGMTTLMSPHINILNLEASLTRTCKKFAEKTFQFAVTPESVIGFAKAGFNMIALANNHSLDCTDPGIRREVRPSLAIIRKAAPDVVFHGVSYHADQLQKVAIQTINGIKVGMVSIKGWAVGPHQPIGNISNRKKIFLALKNAPVDIRILSYHGGEEKSRIPTSDNLKVIHEFIAEYNGDAVFAHHPHVMQGIELLKKKNGRTAVVFHSLGNFLHDKLSRNQDGMMARIEVTRNGIIPVSTQIFPLESESFKPRPINESQLSFAINTIRNSTEAIAKTHLHQDLSREIFEFYEVKQPFPIISIKYKPAPVIQAKSDKIKPQGAPTNPVKLITYPTSGTMGDNKVTDSTHN